MKIKIAFDDCEAEQAKRLCDTVRGHFPRQLYAVRLRETTKEETSERRNVFYLTATSREKGGEAL